MMQALVGEQINGVSCKAPLLLSPMRSQMDSQKSGGLAHIKDIIMILRRGGVKTTLLNHLECPQLCCAAKWKSAKLLTVELGEELVNTVGEGVSTEGNQWTPRESLLNTTPIRRGNLCFANPEDS